MIPVQALESECSPFSKFALDSSMNSQSKTPKLRDDELGSGDQFSMAKKDEGCIVHIIGLEGRGLCSLVGVLGST
jgi:hypothetical protein